MIAFFRFDDLFWFNGKLMHVLSTGNYKLQHHHFLPPNPSIHLYLHEVHPGSNIGDINGDVISVFVSN